MTGFPKPLGFPRRARMAARRLAPVAPALAIAGLLWLLPFPTCLVRIALGVPCPGCGMTRALAALAHLDVRGATAFHPLVVPLSALALAAVSGAFVLEDGAWKTFATRATGVAGIALVLVWALRFAGLFGGPVGG